MVGRILFVIYASVFRYTIRIIKNIAFHTVYDLNSGFLGHTCGIGEALNDSVIGDCNRGLSPFRRQPNNGLDVIKSIETTHLGMTMELNPVLSRVVILSL